MELLIVVLVVMVFEIAAFLGGADTRPRVNDVPRRAI